MTDIYAAHGTEKYVEFAKVMLGQLRALRIDMRLERMTKHYVPAIGVRIDIASSTFGDTIRIFGSNVFLVQTGDFVLSDGVTYHYKTYDRHFKLIGKSVSPAVPAGISRVIRLTASGGSVASLEHTGATTRRVWFQTLSHKWLPGVAQTQLNLDPAISADPAIAMSRDAQHVWTAPWQVTPEQVKLVEASRDGTGAVQTYSIPWAFADNPADAYVPGNRLVVAALGHNVNGVGTPTDHTVATLTHGFGELLTAVSILNRPVTVSASGAWANVYGPPGVVASSDDSTIFAWTDTRDNGIVSAGTYTFNKTARLFQGTTQIDSWADGIGAVSNELGVAPLSGLGVSAATNDTGTALAYTYSSTSGGFFKIYRNGVLTTVATTPASAGQWAALGITNDGNRAVFSADFGPGARLYFYKFDPVLLTWSATGDVAHPGGNMRFDNGSGRLLIWSRSTAAKVFFDAVETDGSLWPSQSVLVEDLFTSQI